MIAQTENLIPILVSALALLGSITAGVLTYRSSMRQARNAERNTDLDQVRAVNDAMRQEIDRLTRAEENCMRRLNDMQTKLAGVERRFAEAREEMREMRNEVLELRRKDTT